MPELVRVAVNAYLSDRTTLFFSEPIQTANPRDAVYEAGVLVGKMIRDGLVVTTPGRDVFWNMAEVVRFLVQELSPGVDPGKTGYPPLDIVVGRHPEERR
jgi:hypothetical protein